MTSTTETQNQTALSRRNFLRLGAFLSCLPLFPVSAVRAGVIFPDSSDTPRLTRKGCFLQLREKLANRAAALGFPRHKNNGDEFSYPYVGSYSKAMPHNGLGEVSRHDYTKLLKAVKSEHVRDWEEVPLGGPKKFKNPLAGVAFDPEGSDSRQFALPPAPGIDGKSCAAEMAELYWAALARDVAFSDYEGDEIIRAGVEDLAASFDPRDLHATVLSPSSLFRGDAVGCLDGPHISQFLFMDIPYGSISFGQKQQTALPSTDYLTQYDGWLAAQNGFAPGITSLDTTRRYIRNGRDLARYVHLDRIHQAFCGYAQALLIRVQDEGVKLRQS